MTVKFTGVIRAAKFASLIILFKDRFCTPSYDMMF